MTRPAVVAGTAAVVLVGAAAATFGWLHRPAPSAAPAPAAVAATAALAPAGDVRAAVININGLVPGGRIAGTGMIITADGIALTNNHVVAGTDSLIAQVAGKARVYRATVLGVDPTQDVAVLRLEGASGLPTVPLDTSGAVNQGDSVTGMGNALGSNGAPVTASGAVTGLNATMMVTGEGAAREYNLLNGLIQFSAPIQPGDSGGPLINASGRVIGMDTAASRAGTVAPDGSVGAAIPITTVLSIAHDILAGVSSPYIQSGHSGVLGVQVGDASGLGGARVDGVTRGDAAAGAGVVDGDVITAVGSLPIHSGADLTAATAGRRPGDRVTVAWRDAAGQAHRATVILSAGPPA